MKKPMHLTCALMHYANLNECRDCPYIKSIDESNDILNEESHAHE